MRKLILVDSLRKPGLGWAESALEMLKGLADRQIAKALQLMHAEPAQPLTVVALARAAGMSRSAFAAWFAAVVGVPQIDYLHGGRTESAGGERSSDVGHRRVKPRIILRSA